MTKSSIVMPAASTVRFMSSIADRVSCSADAGTAMVLGSAPTKPDRYSVLPTRTASLQGEVACSAGVRSRTMFLRSVWAKAGRAAATRMTVVKAHVRSFMTCLLKKVMVNGYRPRMVRLAGRGIDWPAFGSSRPYGLLQFDTDLHDYETSIE